MLLLLPTLPLQAATTSSSATASRATGPPLLGVDPRQLRGEDELRRIFGVGVVEAVERQEAAEAGVWQQRHRAGHDQQIVLGRKASVGRGYAVTVLWWLTVEIFFKFKLWRRPAGLM